MKHLRLLGFLLLLGALLIPATLALAWPDQPPDRATISGPGLNGEVEITDPEILAALKLGAIEDFDRGTIATPSNLGQGYQITRYFYGATFDFGRLHYYPDPSGGSGYIYFEDGPDLEGDHTEYNGQWLYATPGGEAAVQRLLKNLGALSAPALDAKAGTSSLPAAAPNTLLGAVWLIAFGAAAALAGGLLVFRRRRA